MRMEKNRKQKLLMIIALVFCIASLSIGFAAFSTTLNISSSASVSPNSDTFSVKFSSNQNSLVVGLVPPSSKSLGITTTDGVIDNSTNPTIKNLSATFTTPGQYVEYTLYARNEGEYTAYLNNINFIGDKTCKSDGDATDSLVQSACESINITATVGNTTYTETTPITGHTLNKKTGEQIKVRLEYASNGAYVDGSFTIKFPDLVLVYSTLDDSTFVPPITGGGGNGTTLASIVSQNAVSDSSVDFSSSDGLDVENNVAYIVNGTENNQFPIYYYRGNVTKNNVIFANFCWKIVRTTETGGVKLIYNGNPTADNKCNGDNSTIGISKFNINYDSVDDVSYLYSDGKSSTIKQFIDTWYSSNMIAYTEQLEDTVWCNDRSISSVNERFTYFGGHARNEENYQPSLHCYAEYSLTTFATQVSNKLTYPVGLLTVDELTLAGMIRRGYTEEVYLNNYDFWWTMSPSFFGGWHSDANVFVVNEYDGLSESGLMDQDELGVRPAVSIKPGTYILIGDGTAISPYIIN